MVLFQWNLAESGGMGPESSGFHRIPPEWLESDRNRGGHCKVLLFSPNQKVSKLYYCCSCDPSPHPLSLMAFLDPLHLFVLVHQVLLSLPCYFWQLSSMFCTCLPSSPMWLFPSLTHPLFTFGGFSGSFTLSDTQWGGDNELGDNRDGKGQYPLASVSSVSNLIHNLFSTLNIPHSAHISITVKFQWMLSP